MESEMREARQASRERQVRSWVSEGVTEIGWASKCRNLGVENDEVCNGVAEEDWSSEWQEVRTDRECWMSRR
jgi:hypothetical protein